MRFNLANLIIKKKKFFLAIKIYNTIKHQRKIAKKKKKKNKNKILKIFIIFFYIYILFYKISTSIWINMNINTLLIKNGIPITASSKKN